MLTYEPGDSLAHGLDPRAKLCFQFAFAVAAFASTAPSRLAAAGAVALAALAAARLSPLRVLRAYLVVFAFLALAPVIAGVALGPPWFSVEPARESLLAVSRVVPVVVVSAAYVRTTPVRETRAAVQWLVPGRVGRLLGVGVGLVFRFFPVVRRDVRAVRRAILARAGQRRRFTGRTRVLLVRSLQRAMLRADRLALALRARCFAWNPTLPALRFRRRDAVVLAASGALALSAIVPLLP